jgi:hypothetical protein
VDQMWGTDMTQTVTTGEGRAYVFIAVDHCSGEMVGTHASSSASRWEALEPIRQGVAKHFGAVTENVAAGLTLRRADMCQPAWSRSSTAWRQGATSAVNAEQKLAIGRRKSRPPRPWKKDASKRDSGQSAAPTG